jgi:predicted kinase
MGVGKSTIAASLVAQRRLALNVDIDELRVRLGGWQGNPDAKQVARSLGFGLAASHLRDGHDVVLPALFCDFGVIDKVAAIAKTAESTYTEVVIVASLDEVVARLVADRVASRPHPRDEIDDAEFVEHVRFALKVLTERAETRPRAHLINVSGMNAATAADAVCSAVGW